MIKVEGLTKTYQRGRETVRALDDLTLELEKGEFAGILGPSGSGKSTLMNLLGLLDQPTSGRILIDGYPVSGLGKKEVDQMRRKTIGFIFQQLLLVPTMTALQNVMLPLYFAGTARAPRKAAELLELVGLSQRMHHLPGQLSGGEIQRVAVARALANNPAILLADEPTGNLDSRTAREVFALFETINQAGTTVCIVTHNNELAASLPRCITLKDGRKTGDVKKNLH